MATNLDIDTELLEEAQRIGGFKTKKETVNEALREFLQKRDRLGILELFGTIDFRDDWDYKKARGK